MTTVITINILAILFAYLSRYRQFRYGLEISFFIIFLFLALRYNFGNDYHSYYEEFLKINKYSQIDITSKSSGFEPGWIFLCRMFKPFGFFAMTAVLALFNCYVYYRFITKYAPPECYWFAVLIYVFSPGFMLIHASAMRQSLAIALFILSIDYIYSKAAIRYFLLIGLASLIHTSALILLPVYLLGFLNWKINKITGVFLVTLFISLFLFSKSILPILNQFIDVYFERYKIYQAGLVLGTGLGVLYLSLLFLLTIYYERFQDRKTALIFKIAIISFMFIPLSILISLISRAGMYFTPATIIVYPIILMNIKKPIYKALFASIFLFMTIYEFYNFFSTEGWKISFGTYQTIFSAPQIY